MIYFKKEYSTDNYGNSVGYGRLDETKPFDSHDGYDFIARVIFIERDHNRLSIFEDADIIDKDELQDVEKIDKHSYELISGMLSRHITECDFLLNELKPNNHAENNQ